MDIITLINMSLAPLLLISATGLLILGLGNRLGRIIDRLREFSKEVREGGVDESRKKVILKQKKVLLHRGELCRNAMVYYHLTVMFTSLSSIFIFIAALWEDFQYVVMLTFVVSVVTLIIGSIYAAFEITLSYEAIKREAREYLHE